MKKFLLILMIFLMGVGIVGCSSNEPKNLEEYYAISENRGELFTRLNNENSENGSKYLKITFETRENLMIYKYTFATPVKAESISKAIAVKLTDEFVAKEKNRLEELTGFSDISIQYIYYAPDNTEVFNKTFN